MDHQLVGLRPRTVTDLDFHILDQLVCKKKCPMGGQVGRHLIEARVAMVFTRRHTKTSAYAKYPFVDPRSDFLRGLCRI